MSEQVIGRFVKVLRGAELPVSPAETLDAVQVTALLGYQNREALKQGLSLVLAKSEHDKLAFDQCFDDFFRFDGMPPAASAAQSEQPSPSLLDRLRDMMPGQQGGAGAGASSALGQQLLADDSAQLSRQMAEAARNVGLDNIRVITQKGLYGRRIMQALDRKSVV